MQRTNTMPSAPQTSQFTSTWFPETVSLLQVIRWSKLGLSHCSLLNVMTERVSDPSNQRESASHVHGSHLLSKGYPSTTLPEASLEGVCVGMSVLCTKQSAPPADSCDCLLLAIQNRSWGRIPSGKTLNKTTQTHCFALLGCLCASTGISLMCCWGSQGSLHIAITSSTYFSYRPMFAIVTLKI